MGREIRLFGTTTSPYVRRVRAAAIELDYSCTLVNTFDEAGQAELRAINPLWKVPTAIVDGDALLDSRVIVDTLIARHGGEAELAALANDDVTTRNVINVIDGTLDALINVFYLEREGIDAATSRYLSKQRDRARASMAWLDERVDEVWLSPSRRFGLAELALATALGWMRFRDTYPVHEHPALLRCFERHDARPSLAATRPAAA